MNTHIEFVNIYVLICATLRYQYKDVEYFDFGSIGDELYFKFKLPESVEKDIFLKKIIKDLPEVYQLFNFENSKVELIDYIKILKTNKEDYFEDLYGKFLLFGEYSFVNDEKVELVKHLYDNDFKYEEFNSNNESLLKSVHYSAWKMNEIFSLDLFEQQDKNLILSLNCYWTYFFINLDALIRNLNDNDNYKIKLEKIISSIPIKEYKRYSFQKDTDIKSIDMLVRHYRDAVCHLEEKSKKITESFKKIYSGMMIHQNKNQSGIKYGDGYISWNTDLLNLINQISNLIIGEKSVSIIKEKKNDRYLFSVLLHDFGDLRFPLLKQNYRIEKNNDAGLYTIFLKKIA